MAFMGRGVQRGMSTGKSILLNEQIHLFIKSGLYLVREKTSIIPDECPEPVKQCL